MFISSSRQNQNLGGEENLLVIQVSVSYILKHLEDRKAGFLPGIFSGGGTKVSEGRPGKRDLFIFIAPFVRPFSFSNRMEELGSWLVLLYTV